MELAARHLAAFGPAAPRDFAAWSGLPLADARDGWSRVGAELVEIEMSRGSAWMLRSQLDWIGDERDDSMLVRLLPAYDTYLLGYRGRDLVVPPARAKQLHPGGGLLRPALLIDGEVAGTWRLIRCARRLEVAVEPFEELGPESAAALTLETVRLGHVLAESTGLRVEQRR